MEKSWLAWFCQVLVLTLVELGLMHVTSQAVNPVEIEIVGNILLVLHFLGQPLTVKKDISPALPNES